MTHAAATTTSPYDMGARDVDPGPGAIVTAAAAQRYVCLGFVYTLFFVVGTSFRISMVNLLRSRKRHHQSFPAGLHRPTEISPAVALPSEVLCYYAHGSTLIPRHGP
ncbi:hypothetical protein SprV_0301255600 [Sparganum proliferum]